MKLDSAQAAKSKRDDVTVQRMDKVSPLAFGVLGFIVAAVSVGMLVRNIRSRRQRPSFVGRSVTEETPEAEETSEYSPLVLEP